MLKSGLSQYEDLYFQYPKCLAVLQGVTYVIEPPMTTTEQNFTKVMDKSHANRILCFKISSLEKRAPKIKETNLMTSSFRVKATEIQKN